MVLEALGTRSPRRARPGPVEPRALRLRDRRGRRRPRLRGGGVEPRPGEGRRRACARAACRRTRPSRCRRAATACASCCATRSPAGAARTGWRSPSRRPRPARWCCCRRSSWTTRSASWSCRRRRRARSGRARRSGWGPSAFAPRPRPVVANGREQRVCLLAQDGGRAYDAGASFEILPTLVDAAGRVGAVRRLPAVAGGGGRRRLPALRPELHAVGRRRRATTACASASATRRAAGWASRSSRCAWSKIARLRVYSSSWVVPVSRPPIAGGRVAVDGGRVVVGGRPGRPRRSPRARSTTSARACCCPAS